MLDRGDLLAGFVRRLSRWDEQDAPQTECIPGRLGDREMGDVDRVERAAEDADRATEAVGHASSHGCRSHSSSAPPIRTRSPVVTPARRNSVSIPSFAQIALEAFGRFLDVEVGLRRDPLDALAAHPEGTVGVALDDEAVGHGLDAVDDDTRRLGWRLELLGGGQQVGDAGTERVQPLPGGRGDGDRLLALGATRAFECRPRLLRSQEVELVERHEHRLLEERRVVCPQLLADDVVVPLGIARRPIDDVDEDASPLDVAEERVTEAGPARRTFDEARNVGDRGPALVLVAEVHDAEVGLERRERVVGDLGLRGGQGREDRGLARVRQPDEPDVGDEPQLEAQPALLAGLALLGMTRRLMGRRLEMRVAEAAAATARHDRLLAGRNEIGEERARLVLQHGSPGRDVEDEVVAGLAVPPGPCAAPTRGRLEVVAVLEVAERRLSGIDAEVHRPASTTVAAVGSTARHVGLLAEGRGPVATIAGADPDLHAVEEHRGHSRTSRPGRSSVGAPVHRRSDRTDARRARCATDVSGARDGVRVG